MDTWTLGLDPGAGSGWCVYDYTAKRVVDGGTFRDAEMPEEVLRYLPQVTNVVIERPRGQGPTRPQVVECGIVFGRLFESCRRVVLSTAWLYRLDVCQRLSDAVHGTIHVRNDATAWAALVALFGPGSDSRGKTRRGEWLVPPGPLGLIHSHSRAALAVAVASHLPPRK